LSRFPGRGRVEVLLCFGWDIHIVKFQSVKADVLLVLATLIAAGGWIFSMMALRGMPPLLFVGVRFLLAGGIVGVFCIGSLRALTVRQLAPAGLSGAVMCLALVCWIEGLNVSANIGVGAFICTLGNIGAPILGWMLFNERLSVPTILSTLVALVGLAFLLLNDGFHPAVSDLLFLGAACGFSFQFILTSRVSSRIPVLALTSIQLSVVGALMLMISAPFEVWPRSMEPETIVWVAASILIATSLRFLVQFKAQSMASVGRTAIIMNLEPVWTAFIAATWFGMGMSGKHMLGSVLIFLALLVNRWDVVRPVAAKLYLAGLRSLRTGRVP